MLYNSDMFDRRYFVYMLQSSSRRALYIGFTNFLIARNIEHRTGKYPGSFTARYRAWRLVYYEEYGDADAAKDRERQLKGWSRMKKEALIVKMNPKWRDLISEWQEKFGLEFRLDGFIGLKEDQNRNRIKPRDSSTEESGSQRSPCGNQLNQNQHQHQNQPQDPSTPVSRAGENAREPSSAQD